MKEVSTLSVGEWFCIRDSILILTNRGSIESIAVGVTTGTIRHIDNSLQVNTEWWAAISEESTALQWLIMKAAYDGANIERYDKQRNWCSKLKSEKFNWDAYLYRVCENNHSIILDGEEISLTEKEFNNIKGMIHE